MVVLVLVPKIVSGTGPSGLRSGKNGLGPDQTELPQHYVVETDASDYAIVAIISQISPDDGDLHPIAFYSRGMNPAELTAVCMIQGMRLFILKKNKCLVNSISLSILHVMI